jgi:PAS domain S-box-containing protein
MPDESESPEKLRQRVRELTAERDYFRSIAGRQGRRILTDSQDYEQLVRQLRQVQAELQQGKASLETAVRERTAELLWSNTELQAANRRYDEIVARIPCGVYTLSTPPDGSYVFDYISPRLCRMMGLPADRTRHDAVTVFAAVHPDDRPGLDDLTRESVGKSKTFIWEGRFVANDDTRWVRIEGNPAPSPRGGLTWNGIVIDITEQREIREQLRMSEEVYRLVTELAPNAITVSDPDGTIRIVNSSALRLFGEADFSSVVGRSIFDWVAPANRERAMQEFTNLFKAAERIDLELDLLRRDGSSFVGEVSASLLRDPAGKPSLAIIMSSDVTRKRQAETERLMLQKLEAIGTLAGGVAHDFNNLLQGVFGYLSLARLKLDDRQEADELLTLAVAALDQATGLTAQLLTFAKGGATQKRPLDLRPLIRNTARFALSGTASQLVLAIADDLWPVEADGAQIGQVVQNIVLNASEAMDLKGTVTVTATNVRLPQRPGSAGLRQGDVVRITVSDTGGGMTEQVMTRIFDPYFTTKAKGSGLGLATSRSIVTNHGGLLTAASAPGTVTMFTLELPASADQPVPAQGGPSHPVVAAGRRTILLMDDEQMVRDVAGAMLKVLQYDVILAADGKEVLRILEEATRSGRRIDLVILDLTVRGGMGGEETVRLVRQTCPDVMVVVSSGYADSRVLADYRAFGFDASLNKPYSIPSLGDCLNALFAGQAVPTEADPLP